MWLSRGKNEKEINVVLFQFLLDHLQPPDLLPYLFFALEYGTPAVQYIGLDEQHPVLSNHHAGSIV